MPSGAGDLGTIHKGHGVHFFCALHKLPKNLTVPSAMGQDQILPRRHVAPNREGSRRGVQKSVPVYAQTP